MPDCRVPVRRNQETRLGFLLAHNGASSQSCQQGAFLADSSGTWEVDWIASKRNAARCFVDSSARRSTAST